MGECSHLALIVELLVLDITFGKFDEVQIVQPFTKYKKVEFIGSP